MRLPGLLLFFGFNEKEEEITSKTEANKKYFYYGGFYIGFLKIWFVV